MNKGFIFSLGVVIGVAGGGLLANTMLKQRYEQKADEEIAACRNAFLAELEKRRKETEEKSREEKKEAAEKAIQSYSAEPKKAAEMVEKADEKKRPYVISQDVFDDEGNPYNRVELMYLSDGAVLKDGDLLSLDTIDELVGKESLSEFGDDDDRVCVRNENNGNDYEIIQIAETYAEYLRNHPGK